MLVLLFVQGHWGKAHVATRQSDSSLRIPYQIMTAAQVIYEQRVDGTLRNIKKVPRCDDWPLPTQAEIEAMPEIKGVPVGDALTSMCYASTHHWFFQAAGVTLEDAVKAKEEFMGPFYPALQAAMQEHLDAREDKRRAEERSRSAWEQFSSLLSGDRQVTPREFPVW